MEPVERKTDLGIAERIRRSRGRLARNRCLGVRLTAAELAQLDGAATSSGKAIGEWARDILMKQLRSGPTEAATFTEVVALRMQLNIVLRSIALGEKMTLDAYTAALNEVRTCKHKTSEELLRQYAPQRQEQ